MSNQSVIAYYAYSDMFDEVNCCARAHGCLFTLYVDDMTFSSSQPFERQKLSRAVEVILRKYKHRPKNNKVRYYGKSDDKPITGTVVTPAHSLDVPNTLQKNIYDNFQIAKKMPLERQFSEDDTKKLQTLKGQIQAAKNIDPTRFPEIARLSKQIERSGMIPPKKKQTKRPRRRKEKIKIAG